LVGYLLLLKALEAKRLKESDVRLVQFGIGGWQVPR
jgi:hypothetical protein